MERFKRKTKDEDGFKEHVIQNAMGNPIIFKSTPTNNTTKANTWGIFGDDIYVKTASNKLIKLTGTVIS